MNYSSLSKLKEEIELYLDRRSEGVSKKKPEKIQAWTWIEPMTSAIYWCRRSNQLSYQANWELVNWEFVFIPYLGWNTFTAMIYIQFYLYPQFKYMNFIY